MGKITDVAIDLVHPRSFVLDKPFGTGMYELVFFRSDGLVETSDGIVKVKKNSIIVYDRYFKRHYCADGSMLITDFIQFGGDADKINAILKKIVVNKPVEVKNADFIHSLIRLVAYEFKNSHHNRQENIFSLIFVLMKKIEEEMELPGEKSGYAEFEKIRNIRNKIIENPGGKWNVNELAKECSMSENRFRMAYRKAFGKNCIEDVISIRIEFAQYLIRNSSSPIKVIAACSGYDNVTHFSRQFKKACAITPSKYRNLYRNEKNKTIIVPGDE